MERAGPYHLIGRLATGGMAEVFLARREGLGGFEKLAVVKRILPQYAEDHEFRRMFVEEARLAALINHPNVVQIFELSDAGNQLYLVMEYVPGFDVAKIMDSSLKQRRLVPPAVAARILADACAGLDAAHRLVDSRGRPRPVVHRDISPENLLVSEVGQVKVVDFGIARAGEGTTHTRSSSGRLKGKVHYHAPEHILDKEIDGRADVYALGVVLYELLCARRPFEGLGETDVMRACVERDAPHPSTYYPNAEPELSKLALLAVVRDPEKRPTAGQLRDMLELWLRKNPCSASDVERYLREIIPLDAPERTLARKLLSQAPEPKKRSLTQDLAIPNLKARQQNTRKGDGAVDRRWWVAVPVAAAGLVGVGYLLSKGPQGTVTPRPPPVVVAERDAGVQGVSPPEPVVKPPLPQPIPPPDPVLEPIPDTPVTAHTPTWISVTTSPPTDVSIDGAPSRPSPTEELDLPPGKHTIKLTSAGLNLEAVRTIKLLKGKPQKIIFELTKQPVQIVTVPPCKVYIDGVEAGGSPLKLQLYEGRHDLRLESKKGNKLMPLVVKAGSPNKVTVKLDGKK
jgi:serine/threonine-protein kinase